MSNSDLNKKIFVFGIDGATFSLINKWKETGDLPAFESLMKNGTSSVCLSTVPPVSCPAWKSFATGMNPGNLGLFDLVHRESGTYNIQPARADMVEVPDVWDILSANGFKVGIFNVPVTYPAHVVNGFIISGMLGVYEAPNFAYPPELKQEIEAILNDSYQVEIEMKNYSSPDAFLEEQYKNTEMKADIARYLLESKEWNLFVTVFYELDRIQHTFWHYMDKDHPCHSESHLENAIKNSYKRMDKILAKFLDLLEEHVTVMVLSDHGFGSLEGYFRLNQWLLCQNYLKLDEKSKKLFLDDVAQRFLKKEAPKKQLPSDTIGGFYQIDWAHTKAFAMRMGSLYLNVRGREPEGIVEMKKEYEEMRNQLIEDLSTLVHPKTKKSLRITVHKKEDLYSGIHFHEAPDLIISIEDYKYLIEQGFGPMWGGSDDRVRYATGGHRMEGILIVSGDDVKKDRWIGPVSITDIAPTILHIMKTEIPRNMDGKVLLSLFKADSDPAQRQVNISSSIQEYPQLRCSKSREYPLEDEKVLERLRDLGYLE